MDTIQTWVELYLSQKQTTHTRSRLSSHSQCDFSSLHGLQMTLEMELEMAKGRDERTKISIVNSSKKLQS